MALLEIKNLYVGYNTLSGFQYALRGINLSVNGGETVTIVGESGSGKTTLVNAVINYLPPNAVVKGTVVFDGMVIRNDDKVDDGFVRNRWKLMAMVPQASMNIFNPVITIASHFIDTARAYGIDRQEALMRARALLKETGLDPDRVLKSYAHQLSGGMKQRVAIALALLLNPKLVILDEPTSALDVVTQWRILNLLRDLRKVHGFAMLLVTHDISVASYLSNRIYVLYGGRIVEYGSRDEIIRNPMHPYTINLIGSIPTIKSSNPFSSFKLKPGNVNNGNGCPLYYRCPFSTEKCLNDVKITEVSPGHGVGCINIDRVKVRMYG
ncbi:ABC transporter ATP-binding protein [Vulcanisaeta thermophila]|uniref:ABC transporter ATP-binding protein n=1 Tax=Vulcanisaeta thermophila TaxID=867917 RepID=UPI0008535BC1|nr:ABC transporter ATP-binding protein [Vulcanisaeta thermophila]